MCGIAGYAGVAPPELLPSMLRELKHRGPDDDGLHLEPGIGLGATRLAIIDLDTGHQPIANADESAWVVFNGEIYNFRDLRATLQGRGGPSGRAAAPKSFSRRTRRLATRAAGGCAACSPSLSGAGNGGARCW